MRLTHPQCCWVRKTGNVLNKLPKGKHAKLKGMLHDVWMTEIRDRTQRVFDLFEKSYPPGRAVVLALLRNRCDHFDPRENIPAPPGGGE